MVLARSNQDIDQKNSIGTYKFYTLTLRASFAPDQSILSCTDKSKLIHCLEKLAKHNEIHQNAQAEKHRKDTLRVKSQKIAIVDGMVLISMRLSWVWYLQSSLKQKTREKRRQGKDPIQYQIADDANIKPWSCSSMIKHIAMGRFLTHEKTKAYLTECLAQAVLKNNAISQKLVIMSASGHTRSNRDMLLEESNHKEADTVMICSDDTLDTVMIHCLKHGLSSSAQIPMYWFWLLHTMTSSANMRYI